MKPPMLLVITWLPVIFWVKWRKREDGRVLCLQAKAQHLLTPPGHFCMAGHSHGHQALPNVKFSALRGSGELSSPRGGYSAPTCPVFDHIIDLYFLCGAICPLSSMHFTFVSFLSIFSFQFNSVEISLFQFASFHRQCLKAPPQRVQTLHQGICNYH